MLMRVSGKVQVVVGSVRLSPSPEHLSKDAADTPQVHWCSITGLEQYFWSSVPQCHHL